VTCRSERDQAEDGTRGGFGDVQDTEQAAGDPAWRLLFKAQATMSGSNATTAPGSRA
jgi:hypothetical protein